MPYFDDYVAPLHRPAAAWSTLAQRGDGATSPDRFLRASDLGDGGRARRSGRRSCSTRRPARRRCRTARSGSAGATTARAAGTSSSGELEPALTLLGRADELVEVDLPRFDVGEGEARLVAAPRRAGDPRRRPARDDGLRPARRAARRRAAAICRASGPTGYDDPAAVHARLAGGRSPASTGSS